MVDSYGCCGLLQVQASATGRSLVKGSNRVCTVAVCGHMQK
jgi:hypothetical protein